MNKNNNKGFEMAQERIDIIYKAASFMNTIRDFANWCANNYDKDINAEECYYIVEDFVKSNEHIIQKISKVRPPPSSSPSSVILFFYFSTISKIK